VDGSRTQSAARTGVLWSVLRAELDRSRRPRAGPVDVLDLGGGSGVSAVPLAELGHRVTVVDTSADALATLRRRAAEAGVDALVTAVQGEVERPPAVVAAAGYDLVLCHSLLEVVDDPAATLDTVARMTRPGGAASVLAAGRAAAVVARALGGHPEDALRALRDPAGRWGAGDGVLRRFDTNALVALVAAAGLTVEQVHGVRVLAGLLPGAALDGAAGPGSAEALRELEAATATLPPYRDLAAQLHLLARR
jgi:SAM-dependent methyltransferase